MLSWCELYCGSQELVVIPALHVAAMILMEPRELVVHPNWRLHVSLNRNVKRSYLVLIERKLRIVYAVLLHTPRHEEEDDAQSYEGDASQCIKSNGPLRREYRLPRLQPLLCELRP